MISTDQVLDRQDKNLVAVTPEEPRHRLKRLTAEDEILFLCTRRELLETQQRRLREFTCETINWEQVFSTSMRHGVAPLVSVNLQSCNDVFARIPTAVQNQFEECRKRSEIRKQLAEQRIAEIVDFFGARGIDVMLIKGAALDRVLYARSWHTISGDVDLVIHCNRMQLTEADQKLVRSLVRGQETPLQRLIKVEIDWQAHHDVSLNGILAVDFEAIWQRADEVAVLGRRALIMSAEDLFLAACINSCRRRYFRLKSLHEVAEMTQCWNLDWAEIVARAQRWKCTAIVYTALYTADLCVGCRVPDQVLDQLSVKGVRRHVIHYLGQRMSLTTLPQLNTGVRILGKRMGITLILPYATYHWHQILKHVHLTWRERRKAHPGCVARR